MAKTKTDSSAKKPVAAKTSKASKGETNGSVPTSAKKSTSAASSVDISNDLIGDTAGQVWAVLNSQGPQTVASLKKSIGASEELIFSAIGWLAREDKLAFDSNGKAAKISLRD